MRAVRHWGALAAALLAALLLGAPALRAPFFADDWLFLDQARGRGLLEALRAPDPIGNFFRPLGRVLWFWTLGRASGESAAVFHAANLLLWLAAVALLWALARRLAGPRAAAVAAGVFAVTYAADVPVLWASGAQDLLALALALGALLAVAHRRVALGAVLLFAAPLAKETIAVAALPALLLVRAPGDRPGAWAKRAWPLAAAVAAWALLAALVLARRPAPESALALSGWGPLAALAGVARVALGMEWRAGGAPWAPFAIPGGRALLALACAGFAVVLAGLGTRAAAPRPAAAAGKRGARKPAAEAAAPAPAAEPLAPGAWLVAIAWTLAGAAPVALVAPLWSAYYFLFAMAGVALLVAFATRRANGAVAAGVVLAAGLAAHQARALDEFATAPSPWSGQSHVSAFYLQRGMSVAGQCVADLRAQRPSVPRGTTFFFSGVPAFAAVQVADGPLVRGIYRDPTLRSHYASKFRRSLLGQGPVVMLFWDNDARRLVDRTEEQDLWFSLGIGYLLNDSPEVAIEAFEQELTRAPKDPLTRYALAVALTAAGDSVRARPVFESFGMRMQRDAGAAAAEGIRALAAGDTVAARQAAETGRALAPYDPRPHLVLSRIHAAGMARSPVAILEAAAAVAVAPGWAPAWRNWAEVQKKLAHYPEALSSLDRYFALDPAAERDDPDALAWREQLRAVMPGGLGAQRAMKGDLRKP